MTPLERCDQEIRQVEALLRSSHRDVEGLLLALSDWSAERRLILEGTAQEARRAE
jgi:hypothetical protein